MRQTLDGTDWKGLKLRAELEVKGVRYPVTWACLQKLGPRPAVMKGAARANELLAVNPQPDHGGVGCDAVPGLAHEDTGRTGHSVRHRGVDRASGA